MIRYERVRTVMTMLFLLTGDVQIGKTRWMQALVKELSNRGVTPFGVLAPGTWVEHRNDESGSVRYEKTGIDNLLLPQRELVPFARRSDLAHSEGRFDAESQAARAHLAWAIDDSAIMRVNEHFANLGSEATLGETGRVILVVDEFGQLELCRNQGLTQAVSLVDRGATPQVPHAIVIVRRQLLETARKRFADAPWGGIRAISPNESGRRAIAEALGVSL